MVLKNHRALESTQWFPHHCDIVIVSLGYKQCSVPMQNQSCLFITRRVTSCWILDSHCLLQITFYSFSTTTIIYNLWNCNQKYTRCIKQQHFLFSLNQNNSQNNDFFFFMLPYRQFFVLTFDQKLKSQGTIMIRNVTNDTVTVTPIPENLFVNYNFIQISSWQIYLYLNMITTNKDQVQNQYISWKHLPWLRSRQTFVCWGHEQALLLNVRDHAKWIVWASGSGPSDMKQ